jgi:hypothetical protein
MRPKQAILWRIWPNKTGSGFSGSIFTVSSTFVAPTVSFGVEDTVVGCTLTPVSLETVRHIDHAQRQVRRTVVRPIDVHPTISASRSAKCAIHTSRRES